MYDRFREVMYLGVLTLAIGLLWTLAWAKNLTEQNSGYMPAVSNSALAEYARMQAAGEDPEAKPYRIVASSAH